MEPIEAAHAGSRIAHLFRSRVTSVEKLSRVVRGYMKDGQAVIEREDLGWFVLLEGSHERIYVGEEVPQLRTGDEVVVIIRRV